MPPHKSPLEYPTRSFVTSRINGYCPPVATHPAGRKKLTDVLPSIQGQKGVANGRSRNTFCLPSDDEEDVDENESSDDEREVRPKHPLGPSNRSAPVKTGRAAQPLPSDDEDEDDSEDSDQDNQGLLKGHPSLWSNSQRQMRANPTTMRASHPVFDHQKAFRARHGQEQYNSSNSSSSLPRHNTSAPVSASTSAEDLALHNYLHNQESDDEVLGQSRRSGQETHLQQLQHTQRYQQSQLSQFQQQHQSHAPTNKAAQRGQSSVQPQRVTMSGMDLLKQLEQERAEAKRQKPKMSSSTAKIEGLLAKLPEPGLHNISFQQMHVQTPLPKPKKSRSPQAWTGTYEPQRSTMPAVHRTVPTYMAQSVYGYPPPVSTPQRSGNSGKMAHQDTLRPSSSAGDLQPLQRR
ncbi:hypothetical protein J3Q64DRAFT_1816521 [Phycomyces blakesleeanus]|uniref:Uncharacterized protein n=1 Tax=Phycomyces blakesleeanus TaxID=4837 RepID=A0ABR3BAQ4_PHYBL